MNVRLVEAWEGLKWEEHRPSYRADIWTQKNAPPGSQQDDIGWGVYSYELTDVDDVTRTIEWAEEKTREARKQNDVHAAVCALYAVVRTAKGDGHIQLYGVNPTW